MSTLHATTLQDGALQFMRLKGHSKPRVTEDSRDGRCLVYYGKWDKAANNEQDRACPFARRVHKSNAVHYTLNLQKKVRCCFLLSFFASCLVRSAFHLTLCSDSCLVHCFKQMLTMKCWDSDCRNMAKVYRWNERNGSFELGGESKSR